MTLLFTKADLDSLRRDLYGADAELVLYRVTPGEGEAEIGRLSDGWHAHRMPRAMRVSSGFPVGSVALHLAADLSVDVEDLRENAVAEIVTGGLTRRYKVIELTETQQLGGGWAIVMDPLADTV